MDACRVRRGRGGWNGCTWLWKTPTATEGTQGSGGSLGRVGVGAREKAGLVTSARLWMDGREVLSTNANLPTRPTTRETYVAFLPSHACRAMRYTFLLVGNLSDDDHVQCHARPRASLRIPSRKLSTSKISAVCPKVHRICLRLVGPFFNFYTIHRKNPGFACVTRVKRIGFAHLPPFRGNAKPSSFCGITTHTLLLLVIRAPFVVPHALRPPAPRGWTKNPPLHPRPFDGQGFRVRKPSD